MLARTFLPVPCLKEPIVQRGEGMERREEFEGFVEAITVYLNKSVILLNPFTPRCDSNVTSPYNINTF